MQTKFVIRLQEHMMFSVFTLNTDYGIYYVNLL